MEEIESKFQVGDVVQLKSGGPNMTFERFDKHTGSVFCKWFDKDEIHQSNYFNQECLIKKYII